MLILSDVGNFSIIVKSCKVISVIAKKKISIICHFGRFGSLNFKYSRKYKSPLKIAGTTIKEEVEVFSVWPVYSITKRLKRVVHCFTGNICLGRRKYLARAEKSQRVWWGWNRDFAFAENAARGMGKNPRPDKFRMFTKRTGNLQHAKLRLVALSSWWKIARGFPSKFIDTPGGRRRLLNDFTLDRAASRFYNIHTDDIWTVPVYEYKFRSFRWTWWFVKMCSTIGI